MRTDAVVMNEVSSEVKEIIMGRKRKNDSSALHFGMVGVYITNVVMSHW